MHHTKACARAKSPGNVRQRPRRKASTEEEKRRKYRPLAALRSGPIRATRHASLNKKCVCRPKSGQESWEDSIIRCTASSTSYKTKSMNNWHLPDGFRFAGVPCGIRPDEPGRLDLALVVSDRAAAAAGVF